MAEKDNATAIVPFAHGSSVEEANRAGMNWPARLKRKGPTAMCARRSWNELDPIWAKRSPRLLRLA